MLKKLWKQIKEKWGKKPHRSSAAKSYVADAPKPKEISYEKNVIYPNDQYSEVRLNKWLDDVIDKHHGGWLPEDADDY